MRQETGRVSVAVVSGAGVGAGAASAGFSPTKIFRSRAWVREFFAVHQLQAGDKVVVELTGPYRFHVYPLRSGVF